MTILVTGASGFVGSRFLELASNYISEKDRLILLSSIPIEGYTTIIHNNYNVSAKDFYNANIQSIECVVHLGHFTGKGNFEESIQGNMSSVNYTLNLLKAIPPPHGNLFTLVPWMFTACIVRIMLMKKAV